MADDDAVRSRRKRAHASGDHSLCTSRCAAARRKMHLASVPAQIAEVPAGSAGKLDPAAAMEELARQLIAAYYADPGNCALARELRSTLLVLRPGPDAGVADELAILGRYLRTPGGWDDVS